MQNPYMVSAPELTLITFFHYKYVEQDAAICYNDFRYVRLAYGIAAGKLTQDSSHAAPYEPNFHLEVLL